MDALQRPLPPLPESPLRLPAWRALAAALLKHGIQYGDQYPAEYLEAWLGDRKRMRYGIELSKIRRALLQHGFYMIQRESGNCDIATPQGNVGRVMHWFDESKEVLKKGLALGSSTDKTRLDDSDKQRLESINQKTATRLALISRKELA